jgi:HPt (histidine-containing phosphotransfer) domain-containing protein
MKVSQIPGLNVLEGLALCGGDQGIYKEVLEIYIQDAAERLPHFKSFQEALAGTPAEDAVRNFAIEAHALKSASANIGAGALSAQAKSLELAGKASELDVIRMELPAFISALESFSGMLAEALQ